MQNLLLTLIDTRRGWFLNDEGKEVLSLYFLKGSFNFILFPVVLFSPFFLYCLLCPGCTCHCAALLICDVKFLIFYKQMRSYDACLFVWLISFMIMIYISIAFREIEKIPAFCCWIIFHCIYVPHFLKIIHLCYTGYFCVLVIGTPLINK